MSVNTNLKLNPYVSLFTREWIEIILCLVQRKLYQVSLFTREWIEIT